MTAPETLTYDEVADRIEAVLGARPSLSTLRSSRSADRRSKVRHKLQTRLTAGMPDPVGRSGPYTVFSADEIEAWLARHPLRALDAFQTAIASAAADSPRHKISNDLEEAVADGRRHGVSWAAIAEAIAAGRGTSYSKQAAQKRFGGTHPG